MASTARSRVESSPKQTPRDSRKPEEELLASVMVSVSASLEKMSPEEREKAVAAAEKSVSRLQ